MFSRHNSNPDFPVIGTFDDAAEGLGPSSRSGNSLFGAVQRPTRVQLPVPSDMSDCISELQAIGRMQAEMEKSVSRVHSVADASSFPHLRPQISGPQAVDIASNHESKFRFVHLKVEAPRAAGRQSNQDPRMHDIKIFTPKLSGFAESAQPQLMHSASKMLSSAASPAIDFLESPLPHELSAISHVAPTRVNVAGAETESKLNLWQHDASIENRRLFATPAPSTEREQHLKNVNGSNPNSFGNLLQGDTLNPLQVKSSTSRSLAVGASILETSSTAVYTPEYGRAVRTPAAIQTLSHSASKLQLKMQTMDAKNREIDSLLAQFLKRQTEMQNKRMQVVVEPDASNLQQISPYAAKNSPKLGLASPSSASLASPQAKVGISSMFREQSQ